MPEHDADDDADDEGDRERAREAARAHDPEHRRTPRRRSAAPPRGARPSRATRTATPRGTASGRSSRRKTRKMSADRREAAEGECPQDLALDLVGLGLREVDVGADDADRRGTGRLELGHQAGRAPRRPAARCPGWAVRDPAVVLRGGGQSFGRPRPIIAAPGGVDRRVRSRHGRCNRVANRRPTPPGAIVTAELLAIGTELTVGETTDTNSGELARSLVAPGVTVVRISNLPDDLGGRRRRAARPPSAGRTSS